MVSSFPYPINACVTPKNYPGLAHLYPNLDLLQRGEGINGVDLHKQLYQQVLQEFSKYSKCTGEPLEFQYFNGGHGERLIPLPLSRNMAGTVKPVVNKCIDELLRIPIQLNFSSLKQRFSSWAFQCGNSTIDKNIFPVQVFCLSVLIPREKAHEENLYLSAEKFN